jgi:hypothetical protein
MEHVKVGKLFDVSKSGVFIRYGLALIFATLWAASFILPAVKTSKGWYWGWEIALIGWLGPIIVQFGWYANIIMIPSLGYLALSEHKDLKKAARRGTFLVAFGLNSLFWSAFYWDSGSEPIHARSYGYYLWIIAVLGTGTGLLLITLNWRREGSGRPSASADRLR